MNLKVINQENLIVPQNEGDAGYDLISTSEPKIVGEIWMANLYKSVSYIEYDTGVCFKFLKENGLHNFYAKVFPRSSLSKYNLLLCNSVGVIDSGYEDSIKLRFKYIYQPEDVKIIKTNEDVLLNLIHVNKLKIYNKGDKIGQVIFSKHYDIQIENIDNTKNKSQRKMGGFGSTGS